MDISVVHRSDESGTTFVFTSWLSAESSAWNKEVGADKAVQWPTGQGGDGNDGVAAAMTQTQGAIGYLSFDFAVKSDLQVGDDQARRRHVRGAVDRERSAPPAAS